MKGTLVIVLALCVAAVSADQRLTTYIKVDSNVTLSIFNTSVDSQRWTTWGGEASVFGNTVTATLWDSDADVYISIYAAASGNTTSAPYCMMDANQSIEGRDHRLLQVMEQQGLDCEVTQVSQDSFVVNVVASHQHDCSWGAEACPPSQYLQH